MNTYEKFVTGLTKKFDSLDKSQEVSGTEYRAIYGIFERVTGGLLYSVVCDTYDEFVTMFIDDKIHIQQVKR